MRLGELYDAELPAGRRVRSARTDLHVPDRAQRLLGLNALTFDDAQRDEPSSKSGKGDEERQIQERAGAVRVTRHLPVPISKLDGNAISIAANTSTRSDGAPNQ